MIQYKEFAAKIKEKYPQYKNVDDKVLSLSIMKKHPEYREQVSMEEEVVQPAQGVDPKFAQGVVEGVSTITRPDKMLGAMKNVASQGLKPFAQHAATTPDLTPELKAEFQQETAAREMARNEENSMVQDLNKRGIVPPTQINYTNEAGENVNRERTVDDLKSMQQQMNLGVPAQQKFIEGAGKSAEQSLYKINDGIQKIQKGGEILMSGEADVENSTIWMNGIQDIIEGTLGTVYSPVAGVVEATGTQDQAAWVGEQTNNLTKGVISSIAKGINPDIDVESEEFQNNVIRPTQNALKVYMAARQFNAGKPLTKTGEKVGTFAKETVKKGVEGVKDLGKKVFQEVRTKITGVDQKTFDALKANPKAFRTAEKLDDGQYSDKIFSDVRKRIEAKRSELSESGKAYDVVRASKETATMPKNWFKDVLKKEGITVDKSGKLIASSKSTIRNSADLGKLQEIYKTYGGKTTLTSGEILNLRADLSAFPGKLEGSRASAQIFVNKARSAVDKAAKDQLSGLRAVDNKWSALKTQYDELADVLFTKKGYLKKGARSKINNLMRNGNQEQLAAIKQVYPNIEQDLNILKAIENVKSVQGNTVGQYTRAGTVVGGATGNIPLMAATLLANPSVALKLVEIVGKVKGYSSAVVQKAQSALSSGTKLTGAAQALVIESLNSNNDPEILVPFMEYVEENIEE